MRLGIVAVGRVQKGPERDLIARYVDRIGQLSPSLGIKFSIAEVSQSRRGRAVDRMADEAESIGAVASAGAKLIALDERGKSLSSTEFADRLSLFRDDGIADVAIVIGGPDGLSPKVRQSADLVLALGAMSWPHQLVRGMLTEQVYRALTIMAGHPYHRS